MRRGLDRRGRTRGWIVESFNRLVRARGWDFGVVDVVRGAGVGRSTFYEHYRDKDGVRREAMRRVIETLASIVDRDDEPATRSLVEHIATHRHAGLRLLLGARRSIARDLADAIRPRLPEGTKLPRRLAAAQVAASQLGLLEAWLTPLEEPCPPAVLTSAFHASTRALVRSLAVDR